MGIRFFMQEADREGNLIEGSVAKDLERDFEGLMYSEAKGMNNKGKIKNVYSEKYSDSDRLRVHYPSVPTREATSVTFTFFFTGENRRRTYDEFYEYITGGFRAFWDNARNKRLFFFAPNDYKVGEEKCYGGTPYIKLELEVQNYFGCTFDINE